MLICPAQVKLPEGYYFGISASSAENPDSFEIHSFVVSTTNSHSREEPNKARSAQHQQQQILASQQGHEQQTHSQQQQQHNTPNTNANTDIPKILQDVLASNIHSQTDQFADLHNRIQIINNRVTEALAQLTQLQTQYDQHHRELLARIDDRSRALDKIDQTTARLLHELEARDVQGMMQQLHRAIENGQEGLRSSLPVQLGDGMFDIFSFSLSLSLFSSSPLLLFSSSPLLLFSSSPLLVIRPSVCVDGC